MRRRGAVGAGDDRRHGIRPVGDHVVGDASSTSATRPAPRTVTPADDGARFTMPEGTTTTLRVQDQSAPDPVVEGAAVLLVPIVNITDSGAREWELRAVAPGTSTVTGRDPDYSFVVTVT